MIGLGKLGALERAEAAPWYAQYPSELSQLCLPRCRGRTSELPGRAGEISQVQEEHDTLAFTVCYTTHLELGMLTLSRVGAVKISAPDSYQAALRRRIRRGRSRITSARVYFRHGHWWAALGSGVRGASEPATCAACGPDRRRRPGPEVPSCCGHLRPGARTRRPWPAALSGQFRKTRRLRRWSVVGRGGAPATTARKAVFGPTKARITRRRSNDLHHLTKMLVAAYPVICVEDLGVKAISMSPRLGTTTLDHSLGELRRQLTYKGEKYGSHVFVADRFYPSTKTCTRCRAVKAKLPLSVRTYSCESCGSVLDRDVNAAANLALWGEAVLVTEAMATLCGHDTRSGDPDRPGPSVTRPRVKGSKAKRSPRVERPALAGWTFQPVKLDSSKLEAASSSSAPKRCDAPGQGAVEVEASPRKSTLDICSFWRPWREPDRSFRRRNRRRKRAMDGRHSSRVGLHPPGRVYR